MIRTDYKHKPQNTVVWVQYKSNQRLDKTTTQKKELIIITLNGEINE